MKKRFAIIRPFKYVRRLALTSEDPINRIKRWLASMRKGKRKEKVEEKPKKPVKVNVKFIIGSVIILTLFTIIMFLILSLFVPFKIVEIGGWYGKISAIPVNFGTIFDKTNGFYLTISPLFKHGNVTVHAIQTNRVLTGRAFLLYDHHYKVENLKEAYSEISSALEQLGFSVEFIKSSSISTLEQGDVLIVATGKPPKNSVKKMLEFVNRGGIVIYVGDSPTEEVGEEEKLNIVKHLWDEAGISIIKEPPPITEGWYIERGLFSVSGGLLDGQIPYIERKGTLIFFPNYPDIGWATYRGLAEDIRKALILIATGGRDGERIDKFPTIVPTTDKRRQTILLAFLHNKNITFLYPLYAVLRKNYLYFQDSPVIAPTAVVNKPVNINVLLREMASNADTVKLKMGNRTIKLGSVQRGVENTFSIKEAFEKGIYLLTLLGDKEGELTKAGLVVSGLEVEVIENFDENNITLIFKVGGSPQRLDHVEVTINGRKASFSNVRRVTIDLLELLGDVPVGTYTIIVKSGEETVVKKIIKRPKTGLSRLLSPTNMAILFLSFLIYLAGVVFAKKEEEEYRIIVPDIIPLSGKTVKLKKASIIDLFNKVNTFYKWKYMPLKPKELVMGLKNGLIKEKAIVSEYNMTHILDKLVDKGLVVKRLDYYLPTKWIKQSGFSPTMLALFRKVRDVAVSHIIPFTTRISSSQPYHMKLKILWQDVYIYFYTKREDLQYILKHAPAYIKKGLVFIVVPNEEAKEEFLDTLRGAGRGQKALLLALRTNNLFIMTVDELEEKIKELRGG